MEEGDELFWTPGYEEGEIPEDDEETIAVICKVYNAQDMAIQDFLKKQKEGKVNTADQIPKQYKQYKQYEKVFSEEASFRFPPERPWDHAIELKPDAIPRTRCKMYPLAPGEQESLDKFLDEHLKKGYIRPSKSPLASPFFFIKKKDGKLRPVQDYCQLNAMTIKNKYPLPLIPELIDKVHEASYFMKFDVRWGYNNICI